MTRIITATLVALAILAPVATAMPTRDAPAAPSRQLPGPPTWPVDPEPIASAAADTVPATGGDQGTSALVYILPGVVVSILLAAGTAYAVRTSGRARRARIGA